MEVVQEGRSNCCNCNRTDNSGAGAEKKDRRHHHPRSNAGHSHKPDMDSLILSVHSRSSKEGDQLAVVEVEESIQERSNCQTREDYFETVQCI